MEEWRDLPEEMRLSKYQVSSFGRFRNKNTMRISRVEARPDGYMRVGTIDDDNKTNGRMVHILVAIAFIHNPENKPTVDHINGIRDDNRVGNLRWATHQEQASNRKTVLTHKGREIYQLSLGSEIIRKWNKIKDAAIALGISKSNISSCCQGKHHSIGGFKWKYCDNIDILDGEVWKKVPLDESYEEAYASNIGRIRCNNKISYGNKSNQGYMKIYVLHAGKRKSAMVHRLVCFTFHGLPPEGKDQVNHKDGNKENNKANNLEWVSPSENIIHSIDLGLRDYKNVKAKLSIPIVQINTDGEIIAKFNSIQEAYDKTGVARGNISTVCKGKRQLAGGYIWQYANDIRPINKPRGKARAVFQISEGKIICRFDSIAEASRTTRINPTCIISVCKGKRNTSGGFEWRYAEE